MVNARHTSPETPRPSLGLAKHRSRRGVSLEQIADSTKISIRFLRAIESEDFQTLPGGIFSTSYIRQYADAVGFDPDRLLERYHATLACAGDGVAELARIGPQSESGASRPRHWFRAIGP